MQNLHTDQVALTFEAPVIRDYGDLAKITAGLTAGTQTDATFPAHTPIGDLTFS
jgi:hypothetical protein